ncbi:MAG TPA: glycosyltransferase family 4 protein [Candidatus Paceibacterota bacterium]|nr:glycosyltransferase family 4 protein [Candidatus Paceibacterota bacterium]
MKRVLIFSLAYYPSNVSGAEVAIKEITDRIAPSDIEFHLITLLFDKAAPREEMIGNVHVYRVGFGGAYLSKILYIPLAALKARALNKKLHFDALWSMMTYMLMPVMLAKWIGVRVPHVLTLQDGDPYEKVFERPFIKPFVWIIDSGFRTAAVVQAISKYLAEWPAKRGYTGEVIVIPNGASLPSAQEYPAEELEALKQEVGKKDGDALLVTVARLVHQKAQDMVIRALPLLPANVKYLIVGEGPDRPMLEKLVADLGVADRVIFTGQVDRTMTAKYRKISDVFVLPSRSEGQGIAFLSTMAAGIPIVATQEGGIAEFLFDAKRNPGQPTTGWAVDVDSPEQIAAAVQDILAHPDTAREAVKNARKLVTELYNWDLIAPRMEREVFAKAFA